MELDLTPTEDYRHGLQTGEHEAFYFALTSAEGKLCGIVRLLFGRESLLEIVALRLRERTWTHHRRLAITPLEQPAPQAGGDCLTLTCLAPWQSWQIHFDGSLQPADGQDSLPLTMALTFHAVNPPARYRFGAYQQSEQEGRITGTLQAGSEQWTDLLSYRDHSWGRRPMGAAAGWTVLTVPNVFYVAIVDLGDSLFHLGRTLGANGQFAPVATPRLTPTAQGWQFTPSEEWGTFTVQWLGAPLIFHLGQAGEEEARPQARPGDLYHDAIGPARYIAADGRQFTGFVEHARRIAK